MNGGISPMEFVVTKMEVEADEDIPEDGINLSIINELKSRRHLWDSRHKLYKDSEIKRRSWVEVARKLGVREQFLKTRWRSLRDRYMKERRRENQILKTGEPRKVRPWAMMPILDFLNKAAQSSKSNLNSEGNKKEEKEDSDDPSLEPIEKSEPEPQSTVQTASAQNATYLIINPDNSIQCLPSVQLRSPKLRTLRKIQPATSESPRNVTLTIPPTTSVAGSSTLTAQIQQVQSLKPMPRLTHATTITTNRKPDPSQTQEAESSERYFYLSIAKEMEGHSTRVRLKMRKIISDALLKLYEEEEALKETQQEAQEDGPTH